MPETFEINQNRHEKVMESATRNVLKSFGSRLIATLSTVSVLFVTGWLFQILFNF
jgi:nitrate reductase NapE component